MTDNKKIVLVGAGSAAFGPPTLNDIFHSKTLEGSTVVLLDINEEKLNTVYDIVVKENEIKGNKLIIEKTTHRKEAFKNPDFVICSIENGDRFFHRWQDHRIPHTHGSTEMMAENGGPGGFFHSARQIPQIVQIAQDAYKANSKVFFINYSNPVSRISLAIKRAVPDLKFVGLCHQINLLLQDLPYIIDDRLFNKELESLEKVDICKDRLSSTNVIAGGLNHFAFVFGIEDTRTGEDLMPIFNKRLMKYYTKDKWNRFHFDELTFEFYKRLGWFPYVGDNHLAEYVQMAKDHTKYGDFDDWIERMEQANIGTQARFHRYHKRLQKGKYPKKGMMKSQESGERAIAIIEGLIEGKNNLEIVNIPNEGIIDNLPEDLVIECTGKVNKEGIHGLKLGSIPKQVAALLRIEASIQDVCVEAIFKESKDLAIACIAMDVNCGSFKMAEDIFNEMYALQKDRLPNFK
ncbi:MAG: hypothetical protein GF383_16285 [Candidatus Lokiarchaeota archaeon]|nr:hypothetical protein [Candidatus Lokiarchaeota archaeon]MBD3343319.1 hypothetical protein [Candidatus Lokiarchaeota archaeon]